MFIVLLRFSSNQAKASELMAAHNQWLERGLADGTFLLVGSLQPRAGGAILVHGMARSDLEARVQRDPFVAENIVTAEIVEILGSRADPRLQFLLG